MKTPRMIWSRRDVDAARRDAIDHHPAAGEPAEEPEPAPVVDLFTRRRLA